MDTVEVTVADIERLMDRMALERGWLDGKTPYHAAAVALDSTEGGQDFGPLLLQAMRKLLELRVADPKGFDVTVLKTLCPDMTHNDLAQAMTALHHAGWSHRARSREAVKRLVERFPALAGLLSFDRRGGDRHAKPTRRAMAEAFAELAGTRPLSGPAGVYHELACRFGIRGRDGRPSWMAAKKRCQRWDIVPGHDPTRGPGAAPGASAGPPAAPGGQGAATPLAGPARPEGAGAGPPSSPVSFECTTSETKPT